MSIRYHTRPCELGVLLVAASEKGICAVSLGDDADALVEDLKHHHPKARHSDAADLHDLSDSVMAHLEGDISPLTLDLHGTTFQREVWSALQQIPRGDTRTYTELTHSLGRTSDSVRAVASACAANPVAILVPCHRVVGAHGDLVGYRWGLDRKRRLLEKESRQPLLWRHPQASENR